MSEILDGIKKDYADINDAKEEMNRIENNKILDFDDISNYLDDCDNYVDDFIIS